MNYGTVLQSLSFCLPLTLTGAALTYFWLRSAIRTAHSASASEEQEAAVRLDHLEKQLAGYRTRLEEAEQRPLTVGDSFSAPASIQLNRRGQITQLYRRGESPRGIAAALGISQGEVKLILKVHGLTVEKDPAKKRTNLNLKPSSILDNALGVNEGEV